MKKTIFVGQAMPKVKRDPHDWPTLNNWLFSIGISIDDIRKNFFYTALVDYFPGAKGGSHLVPTPDEIKKERRRLSDDFKKFEPEVVVTIGKLSVIHCMDRSVLLKDVVGRVFSANPYNLLENELPIIPLPHPSGASTWYHVEENKKLLKNALETLKYQLNY